jgi:putative membrane protein
MDRQAAWGNHNQTSFKKILMKKIFLLSMIACIAINLVQAQAPDADTTAKHFLIKASIGNLQEISAGQLAAQKATDPEVKAFGQQMVTDHTNAQNELIQLAKAKGVDLPAEATGAVVPDPMLKKASGQTFDRVYVHMMAPGHRQTVSMFQEYSVNGKDPDVKNFAQKTLPVIKGHLKMITGLEDKLKNLSSK